MKIFAATLLLVHLFLIWLISKTIIETYSGTINLARLERFGNKKILIRVLKYLLPVALIGVLANTVGFIDLLWKMYQP